MPNRAERRQSDRFWPVALSAVTYRAGGRRLIDGLNLCLAPGPVTAVMGANGAGKSLLLRLLAGLIRPSSGALTFGGAPPPPPTAHETAIVFQRPVLLRRSVSANLGHALATYGVGRGERRQRIDGLLSLGRLNDVARQPARVLSGGEQQRLAMVRALAAEPRLLLLDEPTASLDPQAAAAIEDMIARAARDGIKVVLVTHDRGQAMRVADDVVFMHGGRITETTDMSAFLHRPSSPEARAYLDGRLLA